MDVWLNRGLFRGATRSRFVEIENQRRASLGFDSGEDFGRIGRDHIYPERHRVRALKDGNA